MRYFVKSAAVAGAILATPATAEVEIGFYFGSQSSPHSVLTGDIEGTAVDRTITWEGKSFDAPPYYGAKVIYWRDTGWGYGIEFTHAKAYASENDRAALGVDRLEFTDGHNIVTANIQRRWENRWWQGQLTPYIAAGVGVAVPHVDIEPAGGDHTYGYQYTGPAVRLGAGISFKLSARVSAFTEYQMTYSDNSIDLDGGGTLDTELITNAVNFGISYGF